MKTNEELARSLCCSGCNKYQCYTNNGSCVNLKNLIMMAEYKDEQYTKEKQGEEIVTTIVNDWTYGKDADHAKIPAIHQRINCFKIGDKVLIKIIKQ